MWLTNQDGRQASSQKHIFLLLHGILQSDLKCYWRQTGPCVKYAKYFLLQLLQMPLQSDLKCCWIQRDTRVKCATYSLLQLLLRSLQSDLECCWRQIYSWPHVCSNSQDTHVDTCPAHFNFSHATKQNTILGWTFCCRTCLMFESQSCSFLPWIFRAPPSVTVIPFRSISS